MAEYIRRKERLLKRKISKTEATVMGLTTVLLTAIVTKNWLKLTGGTDVIFLLQTAGIYNPPSWLVALCLSTAVAATIMGALATFGVASVPLAVLQGLVLADGAAQ